MCFCPYVVPLKRCCICHIFQPWKNFPSDCTKPDGMCYSCKHCTSIKKRAAYQQNKEHRIAYDRAWKKRHRSRILLQRRARYWTNPEKKRREAREWYENHKEKCLEHDRQYRAKNPVKRLLMYRAYNMLHKTERSAWWKSNRTRALVYAANRRARRAALPDTFTETEANFMLTYWHFCCAICGNQRGFFWSLAHDHWIPLASPQCPGTIAENIIPLCHGQGGCNNSKADKDPVV